MKIFSVLVFQLSSAIMPCCAIYLTFPETILSTAFTFVLVMTLGLVIVWSARTPFLYLCWDKCLILHCSFNHFSKTQRFSLHSMGFHTNGVLILRIFFFWITDVVIVCAVWNMSSLFDWLLQSLSCIVLHNEFDASRSVTETLLL